MSRAEEGCRRAALVLASLGPELAAEIFLRLEPHEVDLILAEMARLGTPKSAEVTRILGAFTRQMRDSIRESPDSVPVFSSSPLQRNGSRPDAPHLRDEVTLSQSPLQDRILASLCNEDPASLALSLATLDPEEAVLIMYSLPAEIRSDMARRIVAGDLASESPGGISALQRGIRDAEAAVGQGSGSAGIPETHATGDSSEANQSSGLIELLKNLRKDGDERPQPSGLSDPPHHTE